VIKHATQTLAALTPRFGAADCRLLLRVAERSHLQHFCCVAEMINNAGAAVLLSVTYMIELRMDEIPDNHRLKVIIVIIVITVAVCPRATHRRARIESRFRHT
jgi:hypothetical protein